MIILNDKNEKNINLEFSLDELVIINNSLNEACNNMTESEFHTKIGDGGKDIGRYLLESIGSIIREKDEEWLKFNKN